MRKDMRLGLAVGGLLAAVVLGYGIFFSNPKSKDKLASGSGGGTGSIPSLPGAGTPAQTPAPSTPTTPSAGSGGGTTTPGTTGRPTTPSGGTSQGNTPSAAGTPRDPPASGGGGAPSGFNWSVALNTGAGGELLPSSETPPPHGYRIGGTPGINPELDRESPGGARPATRPSAAGDSANRTSSGPRKYVVKQGDSYWSIAKAEYGNGAYMSHLIRANPRIEPARLKAGVEIVIPDRAAVVPPDVASRSGPAPINIDPARQYRVQSGDSLSTISKKLYGRSDKVNALYDANRDLIGPNLSALKKDMVLTLPEAPTQPVSSTN